MRLDNTHTKKKLLSLKGLAAFIHRSAIFFVCYSIWQKRGLMAVLLWPFSILFGWITTLRRQAFAYGYLRSWRSPVPLIIVGNLSVGGTGKTPIVIALARALYLAGLRPAIISRGYGAQLTQPLSVLPTSAAHSVGDEPLLIARALAVFHIPIWIYPHRVQCVQALLAAHPQTNVIISDDGLQHYQLARDVQRDIEIAVIDPRLLGNRWLLPAGPLRESLKRKRDFTLWTGTAPYPLEEHAFFTPFVLKKDVWQLRNPLTHQPLSMFANLSEGVVLAAAGIGYPEKFFAALRAQGVLCTTLALPDHFKFTHNPFVNHPAQYILITEKDAVKCADFSDPRIWVVPVEAVLDSAFIQKILCRLGTQYG